MCKLQTKEEIQNVSTGRNENNREYTHVLSHSHSTHDYARSKKQKTKNKKIKTTVTSGTRYTSPSISFLRGAGYWGKES